VLSNGGDKSGTHVGRKGGPRNRKPNEQYFGPDWKND
jgi:hypothetical protein